MSATLAASASLAIRRRPVRRRRWLRHAFPYLLVGPSALFLLAITLYPGVFAMWQSLYVTGLARWTWAGLGNYEKLLADPNFWKALGNTALIGGISLAIQGAIALLLAALVYRDPWVRGWRILFLVPMLFMPSAVAFLWKLAFNDGRVINDLLMRIGLIELPIDYLGNAWAARAVLITADVWQWTPFLFIIFVAGLQSQDTEIEEAARLDGATWPRIFWNLSLPLLAPIIAVALILRAIDIVTMFASVFIITQGTPAGATETISYFIYRTGFKQFNFGYASAASVVMLALTIVTAQLLVRRFFRSARDA